MRYVQLLNNLYHKWTMSGCLDCWSKWSNTNFEKKKKIEASLNVFNKMFSVKHISRLMHHPPPSTDLTPFNFCLYSYFENSSLWVRFEDVGEIKRYTTAQFHTISKEEFHRCFDQCKTHWNKCMDCQRNYLVENLIHCPISFLMFFEHTL